MFTDPILKELIKKYPAPKFEDRSNFLYEELIEAVVSQQLSTKAAATIFGRFKTLFWEKIPFPKTSPQHRQRQTASLWDILSKNFLYSSNRSCF